MIASLTGKMSSKDLDRVVIDVGGVGYQVFVSVRTLARLPPSGGQVRLLCHTHIRQDTFKIIGFDDEQERKIFLLLVSVSGIGPRLALTILSGLSPGELSRAIAATDHRRLEKIPGVGRKTAQRLVVELKDKVDSCESEALGYEEEAHSPMNKGAPVIGAMVNLGYGRAAAEKAVLEIMENDGALADEELLRRALKRMMPT